MIYEFDVSCSMTTVKFGVRMLRPDHCSPLQVGTESLNILRIEDTFSNRLPGSLVICWYLASSLNEVRCGYKPSPLLWLLLWVDGIRIAESRGVATGDDVLESVRSSSEGSRRPSECEMSSKVVRSKTAASTAPQARRRTERLLES